MRAFLILSLVLQLSCGSSSTPEFVEYCTPVDTGSEYQHPPVVGMVLDYTQLDTAPLGADPVVQEFLIATEMPLTVVQDSTLNPDSTRYGPVDLAVVDKLSAGPSSPVAARLVWRGKDVVFHPDPRRLYPESSPAFHGVLGGDVLRKFAVKFYYQGDKQCTFTWDQSQTLWPNVLFLREEPRSSSDLADDGFGVVSYSLAGGGHFLDGDEERDFSATRITVGVCMEPDPFPLDPLDLTAGPPAVNSRYPVTGVDMTALVATGMGDLLTTESGIERIHAQVGDTVQLESSTLRLGEDTINTGVVLLSGVHRMAVVSDTSGELGPCAELARRRGQLWAAWNTGLPNPYSKDDGHSGAAVLEVDRGRLESPETFTLLGLSPLHQFWQGLWAELGSSSARVDLVLGHDFLQYYEFTVDYINSRLFMRCVSTDCTSPSAPCCNAKTRVCRCPAGSPCCQYYLARQ